MYGIPAERLAFSVFEDDRQASAIWRDVVAVSEAHIRRMGVPDKFSSSGPTAPEGLCSKIYFDVDPLSRAAVDLENADRFVEI